MFNGKYSRSYGLFFGLLISASSLNGFLCCYQAFAQARPMVAPIYSSLPSEPIVIPSGTMIAMMYEREKILVSKDETIDVTLEVAQELKTTEGNILIPYGAKVFGRLQPEDKGVRFVAESILLQGKQFPLAATSQVVSRTETVEYGHDVSKILKGAAIGASGATLITAVTGFKAISVREILGGAGLGTLNGWVFANVRAAELISIEPNVDLTLTLDSDLILK